MLKKTKNDGRNKKVQIIAQDIKIAKLLAGNNKKVREKTLKNLQKWLQFRAAALPFTEEDFSRIWKGLFYTMWMSDKPLVQEECAESISSLVHFKDEMISLLFFKVGLSTLSNEWFGIDQLRLDKFLMLVRRFLRQGFEICHSTKWNELTVKTFSDILLETVLSSKIVPPLGLVMHFTEIYLEELAKVSNNETDENCTLEFLRPFAVNLLTNNDKRQISCVVQHIFRYLMKQSDLGLEYKEKYNVWRQRKFEGGSIDCIQKIEMPDDDDEENEIDDVSVLKNMPKDPRAGRVDVILPQIPFDPQAIYNLLKECKLICINDSTTGGRKAAKTLESEFLQLANGVYPLGTKEVPVIKKSDRRLNVNDYARELLKFEEDLISDTVEYKQSKKRKRSVTQSDKNETMEEDGLVDPSPTKAKKRKLDEVGNNAKKQEIVKGHDKAKKNTSKINSVKESKNCGLQNRKQKSIVNGLGKNTSKNKCNLEMGKETEVRTSKKEKKMKQKINTLENSASCFRRRSGLWIVEDLELYVKRSMEESQMLLDSNQSQVKEKDIVKSDWEAPLENGEMELYIPANKYKKKLRNKQDTSTPEKDVIVKNPFASPKFATPSSNKKVKIALNLNRSQETSEYEKQLKASPQIPFDAERKPSKPLLKPNCVPSPINPFYKRRSRMSMV